MSTQVDPKIHALTVMKRGQPEVFEFDVNDENAVQEASEKFQELRSEGYLAVKTDGTTGQPTEMATEFDPEAHNIVFTQPFAGGGN